MTMNNDMLMTHCCNCGHLVSKGAAWHEFSERTGGAAAMDLLAAGA